MLISIIFFSVKEMGDDYIINHQRMLQTGAALYEQPSEIGLPMAYMSSVTVGGNLKVRPTKNVRGSRV